MPLTEVIELKLVASQVRRAAESMKKRTKSQLGKVTRNRNIAQNTYVLKGTRIPTATVYRFHKAGYTNEQIISEFPRLTQQDIAAAIEHEERLAG
jgi:uncharacterized protein (DUF433 family)